VSIAAEIINQSADPLYTAALFAVEGNSIDQLFFSEVEFENKINNQAAHSFTIDHFQKFESVLKGPQKVVYLMDNAGEIFFDKLFIQTIQDWREKNSLSLADITCIVKGGPILNDATIEDALVANLYENAKVISSGVNHLGCALEKINETAKIEVLSADMIISKGQANFETLEDVESL